MVLKQAYLGSARSLLFLGGSLPSGSAPHWGAPEMSLPSVPLISLPLPPSRATASGTSSSNTARIVRVPRPPDLQFLPLCLPSCCFFRMECLSPAPSAESAWQTPSHLTNPPQGPPPPGSPPSSSHAPLSRLPLLFVNASLVALITLYFTCLHVCLPLLDCEPFRAWTVSYASLYFSRLARCLAHSRRSINVE